jgi:hypothetical protein
MVLGLNNRSKIRRRSLALAALVFLCQVVAWAWIPTSAMAKQLNTDDALVICTPDGFAKILPDGSKAPFDDSEATAPNQCQICLLVGTLSTPPAVTLAKLPAKVALYALRPLPGDQIASGWFLATLKARAPPIV